MLNSIAATFEGLELPGYDATLMAYRAASIDC